MKNKLFGLGILFALFLSVGAIANAQDVKTTTDENAPVTRGKGFGKFKGDKAGKRHGKRHGKHGGKIFHAIERLNLTDAQREQVKFIAESGKTATQPQREELRGIFEQKRNGGTITEAQQIRARELMGQMKEAGKRTQADVLAVLTPEQRAELDKMKAEMQQKREERRQMREQRGVPSTKEESKIN